ncbi:MAG TPA: sigma-70 family RNA polymerase sigma factor [Bacteroidia bacterium]|nr:sigma-70 family RNA polymerase sigma factor [Bacteroidia bacterium]
MNEYHKSDEELRKELAIVEAAKTDPGKFGALYEKYYRQVFVFVFRRTGEEEQTGDIVANTFLKAMLALPKYTFKGVPFSAWLFRIASNEINMYFRKTNKERVVSLDKSDLGAMIAESGESDSDETQKLLLKALGTLTTDEMQMIELRFFEKRAFIEIGEIIGITENNAKVRTYRILDKLKVLLTKAGGR